MQSYLTQKLAWDVGLLLVGIMVLLPLFYWQGRKRWLRVWSEERVQLVGLVTFVALVTCVAIYKHYFRG